MVLRLFAVGSVALPREGGRGFLSALGQGGRWARPSAAQLTAPPLYPQRVYGENLLLCVRALVAVCREACRGCSLQLMEVLVTVLAFADATGLGDEVSLVGQSAALPST